MWFSGFLFPSRRPWIWIGPRIYKVAARSNILWNLSIYNPIWNYMNLSINLIWQRQDYPEQIGVELLFSISRQNCFWGCFLTFPWGVQLSFPASQPRRQLEAVMGKEMMWILTMQLKSSCFDSPKFQGQKQAGMGSECWECFWSSQ